MKFCVLAKIAKRKVTFWYQSESNPFAPLMIRESNEIPLYFYVNGNDFIFGSAARESFNRHDPNAYGNYFEIIKDPASHFTIHGQKKPIKQLFYYGIEQYLSYFLNTVLFKTESIESYRQHFPLRLIFDADIEDHEKSLIEQLFKEAGYFNQQRLSYHQSLFKVLAQKAVLPNDKVVLLLNGIDDVLYGKLYKNRDEEAIGSFKLHGQGADPRVKILADMIVEYIILQNSYLSIDRDTEIALLLPFCAVLVQRNNPIITGEAELSDGSKQWFRINAHNLNDRLQYYSNDSIIYTAIDDLLKSASVKNEEVIILLGSEEISTTYFSSKLLKKYQYVKALQAADHQDTLKALFADVASTKPEAPARAQAPITPQSPARPIQKPKMPPPLPPKKVSSSPAPAVSAPKLPDPKPLSQETKKVVKLPPLPPKKSSL